MTASPIIDQPGFHGMFMFGTDTLFLSHMPMFTMERHMYQVVLRATLPADIMKEYQAGRTNPDTHYNLSNSQSDPYTLPELKSGRRTSFKADLWADYSNAEAQPVDPPFATEVPVQVERLVHFRHFNADIPYPEHLTYLLFGRNNEAHLSHYIARDPDYQHIVTLGSVPDWLSADQIEAGVELTLVNHASQPVPCSAPLATGSEPVRFQGMPDAQLTLELSGATNVWFSTGNMLNATDPCVAA
jgi:hypothetical protein